ncbi:MAG TPA: hypothetical protein VHM90_06110, partial [Phycisphaerae bacterium]|nr:hypothetical protein [Phycisphaerae bacterium]
MKFATRSLSLAAVLASVLFAACAQEVSHTESDKPGWFGGSKHEETTVYKNPDGTMSTEHSESKTGG